MLLKMIILKSFTPFLSFIINGFVKSFTPVFWYFVKVLPIFYLMFSILPFIFGRERVVSFSSPLKGGERVNDTNTTRSLGVQ